MHKAKIRIHACTSRIGRHIYKYFDKNNDIFYYPIYNINHPMSSQKAEIYNKYGERMDTFFIRDFHMAPHPNWNIGKYFIWDRYNYGLDTHFYTHQAMNETMGHPTQKYGMLIESRAIATRDYEIFKMNKGLEREFKYIFSFDDKILNEVENARFLPTAAAVWYGTSKTNIELDELLYQKKNKNISIVSSNKTYCELHLFRTALAQYCKRERLADTFGTFDGGSLCTIDQSLTDYRYSIAIENDISDYFFCEKITNCFASQTIPIYMGARKINEFFNPDGIIKLETRDFNEIEKILQQCNEKEYEKRLPAILDNYNRVQEYLSMDDYMYRHYIANVTEEK